MDKSVIIVGGGIAGLAAATELARQRVSVTLLEASAVNLQPTTLRWVPSLALTNPACEPREKFAPPFRGR